MIKYVLLLLIFLLMNNFIFLIMCKILLFFIYLFNLISGEYFFLHTLYIFLIIFVK